MSDLLADTHAVLWYLFDPGQLSPPADAALSGATSSGSIIYISTISIIEIVYLVEKNKLPQSAVAGLLTALNDPTLPLRTLPVDMMVAKALQQIPRTAVPDMPDRIIGATALAHNVPLVTADHKLRAAPIHTIW